MCTALCWNAVYIGVVIWGWRVWGLEITGVAFVVSSVILLGAVFFICRKLCGLSWSKGSLKYILVFGTATLLAFLNSKYMPGAKGYVSGGVLSAAVAGYSAYELHKIVGLRSVINRLLRR